MAMASVEQLRRNLQRESDLFEEAMHAVMALLRPRQRAQFYLQVDYQHKSVLRLKQVCE